jgi:hypothetical protein
MSDNEGTKYILCNNDLFFMGQDGLYRVDGSGHIEKVTKRQSKLKSLFWKLKIFWIRVMN